ncbi:single-stranded DNA-binding protein [Baia soyae]|uniref:Single-stranded DNA-binding protein n=1 Tax=Baia soyae TaxID=1544746 RepID=A0A4R2S1N1_9BACL|nr:single-stranded DNA-binding protein [Baia soyae]TCP70260.1 single-strand binding protein [Baia soyae]
MVNRVVLIGRLTADPEMRYTQSGVAVTRFSIAVNRNYTNQQGEREVDFINIVAWRGTAETCANYLKKGRLVGVDGRLQISVYENQEGRKVRNAEVIAESVQFLESNRTREGNGSDFGDSSYGGNSGESFGGSNNHNNNNFGGGWNQNNSSTQGRRKADNPFEDEGKPIDLSDDDLPF